MKLFKPKKYYFIASIRQYKADDGITLEESRCCGFYRSKKKAIKAVENNWSDMNEDGYYPWVVIDPVEEGLLSECLSKDAIWFKEIYSEVNMEELYGSLPEDLRELVTLNKNTGRITWKCRNESTEYWMSNFNGYKRCEAPNFSNKRTCGWGIC